ncbi:hypothetical protein ACI75Y_02885 [Capnocytophaga stomatis]|uniref:Uncharacterized protein n=1 Tax=Capnocytophaga cynodegmi TaxID=28189 RepID=A0A286NTD3_9FLAO|nr:hypothetical protein [Capnocytophaga cynodegmi]ATA67260.1 hypothetical protein CGC48_00685 [Capnocytophaga cynodegmi]
MNKQQLEQRKSEILRELELKVHTKTVIPKNDKKRIIVFSLVGAVVGGVLTFATKQKKGVMIAGVLGGAILSSAISGVIISERAKKEIERINSLRRELDEIEQQI